MVEKSDKFVETSMAKISKHHKNNSLIFGTGIEALFFENKRRQKMKRTLFMTLSLALLMGFTSAPAQEVLPVVHGPNFVDENGDGYNDNAPDSDGDGIPNGQDEDFTGGMMHGRHAVSFVDENGDGFNDNAPDADGDGIPNCYDEDYTGSMSGRGRGFIDENGDGINDRIDADGDGIPNYQDEDYSGPMMRGGMGRGYVDANGDGINDRVDADGDGVPNCQDEDYVPTGTGMPGMRGGHGHRGGSTNP